MFLIETVPERLLFTSSIAIGELRAGALEQRDPVYRERLLQWPDDAVIPQFGERTLPVTLAVGDRWGRIRGESARRGLTLPVTDALIAATALVHGLIVVTRNEEDFRRCGVAVRNPWTE